MLDWIDSRPDLDGDRAGVYGISLGGYYALRAAAHVSRLKAVLGNAGPYNFGDLWDGLPGLTREAFRVRSRSSTDEEARGKAAELTLAGVERVRCPTLVVFGKLDRIIPFSEAERTAAIQGVELVTYETGNHGVTDEAFASRSLMADWLARRLVAG